MQAPKEKPRRYKSNTFGKLPADMLMFLFSQLTIQEIFSLKLTSFIHYKTINPLVSRRKKHEYGTYFQQRITQSLSPEQRTLFSDSLTWKQLVARENLYETIKEKIEMGAIPFTKLNTKDAFNHFLSYGTVLDCSDLYTFGMTEGAKPFRLKEIADIIFRDDAELFIKQGTRLYRLMSYVSFDKPERVKLKVALDKIEEAIEDKFLGRDFMFLRLLPEIIEARAVNCFNMSIRILAGCCFALTKYISNIVDITATIIQSNVPYFIEQYLYLLTCIYPPGDQEIIRVINIYHKQNLHEHVQNCMSRIEKDHRKAIGEHFENYKEPLDTPHGISTNQLPIVESQMEQIRLREHAIEGLQSFLAYLQIDTPMDKTTFTLKRNALNALLENIQDNLEVLDVLEEGLSDAKGVPGYL